MRKELVCLFVWVFPLSLLCDVAGCYPSCHRAFEYAVPLVRTPFPNTRLANAPSPILQASQVWLTKKPLLKSRFPSYGAESFAFKSKGLCEWACLTQWTTAGLCQSFLVLQPAPMQLAQRVC